MPPFAPEPFKECLRVYAYEMSDQAIAPYVRETIKSFLNREYTDRQLYEFCDYISKLPCDVMATTNTGMKIYGGDIDGFLQSFCDVTKYYDVPLDF